MAPNPTLIAIARQQAQSFGLEARLVCAVCEQESSWEPWSLRYEPEFYLHYLLPRVVSGKIDNATEARARAFSWGLMQVMGETAREHGYAGYLAELCEPRTGIAIGCRVLAAKLAWARGDVERALFAWNGGANPDYPAQVLAHMAKYASS